MSSFSPQRYNKVFEMRGVSMFNFKNNAHIATKCFGNDMAVCPDLSLRKIIIWKSTLLLVKGVKIISIIGAIMFNIVATIIYIVFTKIG